jgi:hypothetical protein
MSADFGQRVPVISPVTIGLSSVYLTSGCGPSTDVLVHDRKQSDFSLHAHRAS